MFNAYGDIVMPAEYDDLSPVRNGMIGALKGGRWDAGKLTEEHGFPWVGSKQLLINIHNKVIIENFHYDAEINFFSLVISKSPNKSPIRVNFKTTDGKYYSFINFDKEFKIWLRDSLLKGFSKIKLLNTSYKSITFWDQQKGWINEPKQHFVANNFEMLRLKLSELNFPNTDYSTSTEGLNPFIYTSEDFEKYYDNCGASKDWIYPIKTLTIDHKINNDLSQDQFSFLRTDHGYKLIEVSIRVGDIQ